MTAMEEGPELESQEGPATAGPSPSTNSLKKTDTIRTLGRFKMRGVADDLPQ